ncbi:hypothetical protein LWI29_017968 [Acer saccharum]|uniref:non-specific serine/threonine protein kinase n=1 Tax=Acer saccharum TaxID=4024 RepID=A0AA39W5S1_ACESA|nr:hypothetical protein LWI29_017968 [Acer saccharum]
MASAGSSSSAESQISVVEENPNGQISAPPCLKEFSFADLKTATSNFGHEALLGAGAYGRVYIGWFDEKTLSRPSESGIGRAVAIKIYYPETIQAFDQWQSEVNILGRRYHPNLIELLGYSWEDEKLVLVYEFMQKGSLENHLFQSDVFKPLSWDIRLRIAIGAARGLVFLHSLEKQIIYRDFKSSAILLDANYNPKLSDFGLAKLGPSGDKTHVTTRMMGTEGYVAPEYFESGHLNAKSDVYSFGIVLLELLTGLRAVDLRRTNDNLVEWLKPMLSQLKTLMDVRMVGQYSLGAACNATQLTLKCLEVNHKDRPSMKDVLEELVQIEAMASMKEVPEVLEQIEAVTSNLKEFNFEDLQIATNNFKPEALLGEGGYGRVYKGWIDEKTLTPSEWGTGMAVAIKLWNPETVQAFEQWQLEVNILGRRHHPNLVKLLGYCWEDEMLVLVYEFMQKGSLTNLLSQRNAIKTLSWDIRLKIAIGAARGLLFLHTLETQIIYRDFKSSVILLDAKYNPKISDLGLAKLGPSGDKTHVTTRMMGTDGYAAPEYIRFGHLTAKSDVYSFGVMLLELWMGFKEVGTRRRKEYLVEWLKPMLSQNRKLQTIMGVWMEGQHSSEATSQAAQLIQKCLSIDPEDRPSMKEVMEVLVQIQAMTFMKKVPEELEQIKVMEEKPKKSKFSSPRCSVAPPRHRQPRRFLTSLKASCQYIGACRYGDRCSRLAVSTPNPASAPPFCSPTSTNVNIQQHFQVHLTIKKMLATPHLKEFSFEELKMATRNFSAQLGDGGLWKVYKGWMDEKTLAPSKTGDSMLVAIKEFNPNREQHFELWQAEVNILGRHYHPNLIGLLGYCWEDEKLLLVNEFMHKGSLNTHLFRRNSDIKPLS